MKLTTEISINKAGEGNFIDYDSKMLVMGSCFADNISKKMSYYGFDVNSNEFGVIFNIYSIKKLIKRSLGGDFFKEDDLFFLNEVWNCFEVHSCCSGDDRVETIARLNEKLEFLRHRIKEASHIIITLGTSWVYCEKSRGEIVANCYKVPQGNFDKILLTSSQNEASLREIEETVREVNKDVKFVYTISPVRHLKDGFVENMRSKAEMVCGLHNFLEGREKSFYFPAYEILMDELRDYRYYGEDLVHPSGVGVDYIFEKFMNSWIRESEWEIMKEVYNVRKSQNHRPFNNKGESYSKFLKNVEEKIDKIKRYNSNIKI